ncbi:MAG: DUF4214 domain-containing protein [Thermoanaerobaculia bacterium]|nr:DUF4214 domain-containing protein [Thermoanaerobaculia bacterium]
MKFRLFTAVAVLICAFGLQATTFEPLTDRDLVGRSDAVFVGTIGEVSSRMTEEGLIFTDAEVRVEEVLKGRLQPSQVITLSEAGGKVGNIGMVVDGGAVYEKGQRLLIFAKRNGDRYFTTSMSRGRFEFRRNMRGQAIVMHEDFDGIADTPRLQSEFMGFVRETARGRMVSPSYASDAAAKRPLVPIADAASDYTMKENRAAGLLGLRWPTDNIPVFSVTGTQPGGVNPNTIASGAAAWTNEPLSRVSIATNGTTPNSSPGNLGDGNNTIFLNFTGTVPGQAICSGVGGGVVGCGVVWFNDSFTHQFAGETFYSIFRAHVLIFPAVTTQSVFDVVITHELGHTIGLRHSNEASPASGAAIMNSIVNTGFGQTLQQWDREAASTVYGDGPPCVPPTINNVNGGGSVSQGATAQLTANVSGTTPFTYQWYRGTKPNTSQPVGTNSPTYQTPPINTTESFWVKVQNACGFAESNTVTVTPVACSAPKVTAQPQSATVSANAVVTLSVQNSGTGPFTYTWFKGAKGDVSNQVQSGANNAFTTPPITATTSYWVQISNTCGVDASETATLTVPGTCASPTLPVTPRSSTIVSPRPVVLTAGGAGAGQLTYQWFRGAIGNTSDPLTGITGPSNDRFLKMLFVDLFGRVIDPGEASLYGGQLSGGSTRGVLVGMLLESEEYRGAFINTQYELMLRRSATAADRAFWNAVLISGSSAESVIASILASPEYYAGSGATPSSWLSRAYSDLIGRAPGTAETSLYLGELAAGAPRQRIAESIVVSSEARGRVIAGLYDRFLRRSATQSEIAGFLPQFNDGNYLEVIAAIASSDEYFSFGSVLITPVVSTTTTFWINLTNACGNARAAATVSIGQCIAPVFTTSPSNTTVSAGAPFTLGVAIAGTPSSIQWFEGEKGDTSKPVANSNASFITLTKNSPGSYRYWARATSTCGNADSNAATVTVNCSFEKPSIEVSPVAKKGGVVTVKFVLIPGVSYGARANTGATIAACGNDLFCITPPASFVGTLSISIDATVNCPNGPTTATSTIEVSVLDVPPSNSSQFNLASNPCTGASCGVTQPFFISGAATPGTFTISADRPFVSFAPSSGPLPVAGTTVQMTVNTNGLDVGSAGFTVTIVKTTADPESRTASGNTTTTTPVNISIVTPVSPKGKAPNPPSNTLIIAAVASNDGAIGSRFISDIRISNISSSSQNYQLTFTPTATNGTTTGRQLALTIAANDTKALDNIVRTWFGNPTDAQGALEIRSTSGGSSTGVGLVTVASSRTYNSTPAGTFGQFVPALPITSFLSAVDARISLQQVAQNPSTFRTNIGLVEGSGEPATVVLKLVDGLNRQLATTNKTLQPYEMIQIGVPTLFFPGQDVQQIKITDARVEITVVSPTGKVNAFASVLDNKTSDPIMILAARPNTIRARRYVVPGVAEKDLGFTNFRSDLRIFNGGASAVTMTVNLTPDAGTAPAPVQLTLQPNEVRAIDDTLRTLFNVNNVGGALVITTAQNSSLVVTGRTYTRRSDGGTLGLFIPGVTSAEGVGAGQRPLQVLQLEQSPNFRSNLGLVELTGKPVNLRLRLIAADSRVSAIVDTTLNAGEFKQFGAVMQSLGTVYNGKVTVEVTAGAGRVAAYGANIDNRTSDPTFIPGQ